VTSVDGNSGTRSLVDRVGAGVEQQRGNRADEPARFVNEPP
jgi:hypothetical protein